MTQAQGIQEVKAKVSKLLEEKLKDFDQIDDFSWIILEEDSAGNERWVEVKIVGKKKFDLDEALDEFNFKKKERGEG